MVLSMLEREFIILAWIDNWGPQVAWGIRIAMTVIGGGLWLASRKAESAAP